MQLFGEDVHELKLPVYRPCNGRNIPSFVVPVLSLPHLRIASITDCPKQLAAVSTSHTIEQLSLTFIVGRSIVSASPSPFTYLTDLPLKKLHTKCEWKPSYPRGYFRCPYQHDPALIISKTSQGIKTLLPHLTHLDLDCDCPREGAEHALWTFLPHQTLLIELTIRWYVVSSSIPDRICPFLRNLSSVRILGEGVDIPSLTFDDLPYPPSISFMHGNFQTAPKTPLAPLVGQAVTEIEYTSPLLGYRLLTSQHILELTKYHRLRSIALPLANDVEQVLPQLATALPDLERLALHPNDRRHYGVRPGAILQTVQSAGKLSDLRLKAIRIGLAEMVDVLRILGVRLRVLGVSIHRQVEPPVNRLQALLLAAAKYNADLRKFDVFDVNCHPTRDRIASRHFRRERPSSTDKFVARLRQCVPAVSAYNLGSYLDEVP